MANNKMLIDASHPEETRVAVVRGNRIEEFDFESQAKKQLRGNIYLAKVTRVEPSLQAAFVDYGGNRHGFLAFSEIHPDYYQIPTADRQALLEEEAAEQAEIVEQEDALADDEDQSGKGRRSRGRKKPSRRSAKASDEAAQEDDDSADDTDGSPEDPGEEDDLQASEVADDSDEDADESGSDEDDDDDSDDDSGAEKTIAAVIETDSISEPAPEDPQDGENDTPAEAEKAEAAEEPKAKPKRRTTRRKPAKKAVAEDGDKEAVAAEPASSEGDAGSSDAGDEAEADAGSDKKDEEEKPSPKKRQARGRRRRRGSDDENAGDEGSDGENSAADKPADDEEAVESVGQEDALEEVPFRRKPRRQYKIQEVIKRRQVMLVQVVKEERGNKGAALTTYLSLAGRYSVLMPNTARGGGISRKITNSADRKRLKTIASELDVPNGMGVILRTAGASRTKAEVKRDFEYLMRLWENVRSLTLSSNAPCLVYEEGSLIKRSIRDLYDKDTGEVLVSGEGGYKEAKEFMRMLMPSHAKNVKPYAEDQAIFSRYSVEQQLDRLLTAQVTLKSGGYLVINQTEALVAIDVNSGRATREHSIEDTAYKTNLEAADEIARQLRLRDLAGLIVIDFIDMEEKRNNRNVEKRLKDALKNDRARIQVGRISHFGLMEMSRQRIRASVIESTMDICPHCGGAGHVRSDTAIALHVFRGIEDHAMRNSRNDVIVRCPTSVAIDILNSKRAGLRDIEERFGLQIVIEADPSLPGQTFVIEKGGPATGTPAKPVQIAPDYLADDMDDEIEDEVESDNELAEAREENGDEGGRRKRRRRRGRRRDHHGDADGNRETESGRAEQPDEAEGIGEPGGDGDDDDGGEEDRGGRRRRRRGKRGGRKNKSNADERQETEAEIGDDSANEDHVSANEEAPEPVAQDASGDDEKKAGKAEAEPDPDLEDDAENDEAQASPRGRNTRRPRKSSGAEKDADAEENGDVIVAEPGEKEDQGDDGKPRRSGWWNRGGGFF